MTGFSREDDASSSPFEQPPDVEMLPLCARCVREGGITLWGRHHDPRQAIIHPNHVFREKKMRGGRVVESWILRAPPPEPLCGFHVELEAWEAHGALNGYRLPPWKDPSRLHTPPEEKA